MQTNINQIVENSLDDSYVKSYKGYTMAVKKAEEAKLTAEKSFLMEEDQEYIPMMYVIVQRSDGRFVPVFLLTHFLRVNEFGGYIMVLSRMGYLNI